MRRRICRGMTLIETLVVTAILGMLIALLIPAVQGARESGRKAVCRNNLRQMGLALLHHHTARNSLPAGRDGNLGRDHSWATAILPYLEQKELHRQYDFNKPWYDGGTVTWANGVGQGFPDISQVAPGTNAALAQTMLAVFRCPTSEDWPGCIDYGGNYGTVLTGLPPGFAKGQGWSAGTLLAINLSLGNGQDRLLPVNTSEISDGAANTFLVLEDADRKADQGGLWANGHNCIAVDAPGINKDVSSEIFSLHRGGAHALMCDGAVRFLAEAIEPRVLGAHCTRRGRD